MPNKIIKVVISLTLVHFPPHENGEKKALFQKKVPKYCFCVDVRPKRRAKMKI